MNPQEIPKAYDLSKVEDLWKLSNGLTLAERNALREKFVQEKQAIIYLTQAEITELQSTLSSENNHHSDRVERVASFLEQQKSEGFSLGDLIPAESAFSEKIEKLGIQGTSHIIFVIGGSIGIGKAVLEKSDYALSFSKMTFPHQLMRVILLEQIYRGYRIMSGEPYHK